MAEIKFGKKRICLNCDVKFYDLNKKSPLICPHCNHKIEIEDESFAIHNSNDVKQQNKNEIKDEFSEIDNADNSDDSDDEVISLDDAAIEEEQKSND